MSEAPGREGGTEKRPLNTVILRTVKLKKHFSYFKKRQIFLNQLLTMWSYKNTEPSVKVGTVLIIFA